MRAVKRFWKSHFPPNVDKLWTQCALLPVGLWTALVLRLEPTRGLCGNLSHQWSALLCLAMYAPVSSADSGSEGR